MTTHPTTSSVPDVHAQGHSGRLPTSMKALRIHTRGGSQGLVYEDAPVPALGPTDVLVEVHATSITFHEFEWPETWVDADGKDRTPVIPAHEFSGVVLATGPAVSAFAVGDEVFGIPGFTRDGAAAEYVAADENEIAHRPLSLPHTAVAASVLAALTAWEALTTHAPTRPGDHVVVLGAAGGVGSYAVQIAKSLGATVTGSVRNSQGMRAADLGVDEVVATGTEGLRAALQRADTVIDTIGGTVLASAAASMQDGARLITLGAPIDPAILEGRSIDATFFIVTPNRKQLENISRLLDSGQLRSTVAATYSLANGRQAYEEGARMGRAGKTVLIVQDSPATSRA